MLIQRRLKSYGDHCLGKLSARDATQFAATRVAIHISLVVINAADSSAIMRSTCLETLLDNCSFSQSIYVTICVVLLFQMLKTYSQLYLTWEIVAY